MNGGSIDSIYTWLKYGCYQRTLHYHNTPQINRKLYEKQLDYIKEHYEPVSPEDIKKYIKNGRKKKLPSIIIGVFDGYRNNYEVLHKFLEQRDMKGWYLLVTDFLNASKEKQEEILLSYRMQWVPDEYPDGRYAMNWEEASKVAEQHTIVNHTSTHYRLTAETREDTLHYEIFEAHRHIQGKLGQSPDVFSWLGGSGLRKNEVADRILRELGYDFLMGYCLEYFTSVEVNKKFEWESAVSDETSACLLETEIRRQEQVFGNIGWYSAVPAILPLYQSGRLITDGRDEQDIELAEHFTALARHLMQVKGMQETQAAQTALDVLAVNRIGEEFPFW